MPRGQAADQTLWGILRLKLPPVPTAPAERQVNRERARTMLSIALG